MQKLELINLMEEEVRKIVPQMIKNKEGVCQCPRCEIDTLAIVLNNVEPKYMVVDEKSAYNRIDLMKQQCYVDIAMNIEKAIEIVKKNPRH